MHMTKMCTGRAPASLTRTQFQECFNVRFYDPAIDAERDAIARLEGIAWEALQECRKAPITRPAGPGFADLTYGLSVQWLDTRARLKAAQNLWGDSAALPRVLLVCGSARTDGTCPGELSPVKGLCVERDAAVLLVKPERGLARHGRHMTEGAITPSTLSYTVSACRRTRPMRERPYKSSAFHRVSCSL